jgi:branched-subunit amino acid aminotransferase/4-amino-4-deoxychorismate lyase
LHPLLPVWIDGEIRPRAEAALRGDDSAALEGRGCYTTVLVRAGVPCWPERHAARLARDAARLGLGPVDRSRVLAALDDLIESALARADGAIRIQASRDGAGRLHLLGLPRSLGDERPEWRAIGASVVHPGPTAWAGVKVTNRLEMGFAREEAEAAGADEALLFDREGFAVEGSRSNLLWVDEGGELAAVGSGRGAVAGIALEVVVEAIPGLPRVDADRDALARAREIVAVNALRGARPVVELDGRPVGDGRPGPAWRRLCEALALP